LVYIQPFKNRNLSKEAGLSAAGLVISLASKTKYKKEYAMKTPIEIVKAFNTAMEQKDFDTALQYVSEDCEYTNIPMSTVRGPAGIRAVLEPFFAPTIENRFLILREAAVGPVVFLERLDRHLLSTGWVELPVVGVYEVHNGLITVYRDYFDLATIMSKWPK
jgi:limonene-1,2-epoxide hydrolase